jgi:hypothetical protein
MVGRTGHSSANRTWHSQCAGMRGVTVQPGSASSMEQDGKRGTGEGREPVEGEGVVVGQIETTVDHVGRWVQDVSLGKAISYETAEKGRDSPMAGGLDAVPLDQSNELLWIPRERAIRRV